MDFSLHIFVIPWITFLVCRTIYRLSFHPLARFPGPKLAAVTKWYETYFELVQRPGGQYSREIDRMHDHYGPIVRISPDEIHVRDPTWYDVLYVSNLHARDKYPPTARMAGTPLAAFGTVNHELHLKRRAAIASIFTKRAIQESEPLIKEQIKLLVAIFEESLVSRKPISLETLFLAFAGNTIGLYAFNLDFNFIKDTEAAESWRKTMNSVAFTTVVARQFPWLISSIMAIPRGLVKPLFPDICRLLDAFAKISNSVATHISTRTPAENKPMLQIGRERPLTLFHAIDQSSLSAPEKRPDRLLQEGMTLLFAGGETVAHSLSHIMFHLLDNPEIYSKIKRELDEATPMGETIPSLHTLERLPWLSASIREGLRLSCPVSSRLTQMARSELHYGEWMIPANASKQNIIKYFRTNAEKQTPISMHPTSVLHDSSVYPEPHKFAPDRWFDAPSQANRCFVPFGKGARMCQGIDLAYAEMFLVVATLVRTFKMELFDTYRKRDIDPVRDYFVGFPETCSRGVRVLVRAMD